MQQFLVTGMSCAACSARVENAVRALPEVTSCAVNLLTKRMSVEGNVSQASIVQAVENAGYGASPMGTGQKTNAGTQDPEVEYAKEVAVLKKRLISSLLLMLPLLYISMGHALLRLPLPSFLDQNPVGLGILQMLIAAAVMVINQKFFISGTKGLLNNAPNMDTLVALGSTASFAWSVSILLSLTKESGTPIAAHFYFETAAMIVTLITVGKLLEARSKGKTTDAVKRLLELAPQKATVLRESQEIDIPVADVRVGDIFLVRPGGSIPVDGVIVEGSSAINEAALTGESIPVDKTVGDNVFAATTNTDGFLQCRATRVGEDTTLAHIIQLVNDANATKAPIAKLADKISAIFVPLVICIAAVTILIWLLVGQDLGFALARGIAVLVISCPCALGLATPVAIMVGSGVGAKNGILFKTAESLEQTGHTAIVALDKTGTITTGTPSVTDCVPLNCSEKELLQKAYSLERLSEHPIAKAIVAYATAKGIDALSLNNFQAHIGNGLTADLNGQCLACGKLSFIQERLPIPDTVRTKADEFAAQGKTPIVLSEGEKLLGILAIADILKPDSKAAIDDLRAMGIRVVMLTGDTRRTAEALAREAGVDNVAAEVVPSDKEQIVRLLTEHGATAMVGDGINDAPALTRANTGIAIGAGTDIAIDAADVVLVKSSLADVPAAIRLSQATLTTIRQNLFWAFFYNCVGIPVAAGLFYPLFGWTLNPMLGAAAMSLSSFCVVTNALRLNRFDPKKADTTHHVAKPISVDALTQSLAAVKKQGVQKILTIEGMMCPHCEGRVKKALEAVPTVTSAQASHTAGTATVTLTNPNDGIDKELTQAVVDAGYTVVGIRQS